MEDCLNDWPVGDWGRFDDKVDSCTNRLGCEAERGEAVRRGNQKPRSSIPTLTLTRHDTTTTAKPCTEGMVTVLYL